MENRKELGIYFFLHINLHSKEKNHKIIIFVRKWQGFFFSCACLSFRLSPRLIIANAALKMTSNIRYLLFRKNEF